MKNSDFKTNISDKMKVRDDIIAKGDKIVNDMASLKSEMDSLGELDDETRTSLETAIMSAQKDVESAFENDVENELEGLDGELEELSSEAQEKASVASDVKSNINKIEFEYMNSSILSDAASEAQASESEWIETLQQINNEQKTTQEKINGLREALGG